MRPGNSNVLSSVRNATKHGKRGINDLELWASSAQAVLESLRQPLRRDVYFRCTEGCLFIYLFNLV
jgi:hypothetical protein